MSKKRIPSHDSKTSGATEVIVESGLRFIGLSLSGGKNDKACVAVIEYFPKHKKIFLTKIFDKIKNEESISADLKIVEIVEQYKSNLQSLSLDTPFRMPYCLRCQVRCPGYEACQLKPMTWMQKFSEAKNKKKKPRKLFTPYTQRCVEMYLSSEIEEPFIMNHAMGANEAPLLARALFLRKRIEAPFLEVFPKLTLWRMGQSLGIMKRHLRFHRHAVSGVESRKAILKALNEENVAFVYQQDLQIMAENNHAFEAFLCALTGFLTYQGLTESQPQGFPEEEDWIEFPKKNISWKF